MSNGKINHSFPLVGKCVCFCVFDIFDTTECILWHFASLLDNKLQPLGFFFPKIFLLNADLRSPCGLLLKHYFR